MSPLTVAPITSQSTAKGALFYKALKSGSVQCQLCPRLCVLPDGFWGNCNARKNINGKLFSEVYGRVAAMAIDPIEKKPLFHFFPGTRIFSFGTAGCNLHCRFCQNHSMAQSRPDDIPFEKVSPEQIVDAAIKSGCPSIAYTYNEPYIFYEFVLETAKLARKNGLKNVMVTNGFCLPGPTKRLYKYIGAANIDLKGFSDDFYKKYCDACLNPVLDTILHIKEMGVHVELTNLLIPSLNDDKESLTTLCNWIADSLGSDQIIHFSAFHPDHKMGSHPSTPITKLLMAKAIAEKSGLKYIYLGNVRYKDSATTFCPMCKKAMITRDFQVNNLLSKNKCFACNAEIPGVF